jgi:hypothetical protein
MFDVISRARIRRVMQRVACYGRLYLDGYVALVSIRTFFRLAMLNTKVPDTELSQSRHDVLLSIMRGAGRTVGLSELFLRDDVVLWGVEVHGNLRLKLASHYCGCSCDCSVRLSNKGVGLIVLGPFLRFRHMQSLPSPAKTKDDPELSRPKSLGQVNFSGFRSCPPLKNLIDWKRTGQYSSRKWSVRNHDELHVDIHLQLFNL